jgi:transcriptional regulator of acetoin/glycerol metabolism
VDVSIFSATQKSLAELVPQGLFGEDLERRSPREFRWCLETLPELPTVHGKKVFLAQLQVDREASDTLHQADID